MAKPKRTPVSAHQHTHRFSPSREFRLFDLPLELRLCIYEAYAKTNKRRHYLTLKSGKSVEIVFKSTNVALLATTRQIAQEARKCIQASLAEVISQPARLTIYYRSYHLRRAPLYLCRALAIAMMQRIERTFQYLQCRCPPSEIVHPIWTALGICVDPQWQWPKDGFTNGAVGGLPWLTREDLRDMPETDAVVFLEGR
jgi:hypothetical protein